jgi:hypothetical protein
MPTLRILLLCIAVTLVAAPADAQLGGPVFLDLSSPILMPGEIGEAIVSGLAACPEVISVETSSDTVIISFEAHCPILPPGPAPFEIRVPVGPLSIGVYTVEVREFSSGDLLVSSPWQVGYPYGTFGLEITPTPVAPGEAAQAIITGQASCPNFRGLETNGSQIDLLIDLDCLFIPPDPFDFRIVVDLDPLTAGDYTLAVRDTLDRVIFVLEDFLVADTPSQLRLEPPIATDLDRVVARIDGFATCPSLRSIELGMPEIEITYSTGCPFTPPPPPADFLLTVELGQLDPGDYTLVLHNVSTGEVLTRDLLVVETSPPLRFEPEFPTNETPVTVIAGIPGVQVCSPAPMVTVTGDQVEIVVNDSCFVPTPGPAGAPTPVTDVPVELGLLPADNYTATVRGIEGNLLSRRRFAVRTAGACVPSSTVLCLQGGRFEVRVDYTSDAGSGAALATQETSESGSFTFFDENNVELVVKVLDACFTSFQTYWIFAAGLTNVGVVLEVTDTENSVTRRYENPQGQPFETILDTQGFLTCQ